MSTRAPQGPHEISSWDPEPHERSTSPKAGQLAELKRRRRGLLPSSIHFRTLPLARARNQRAHGNHASRLTNRLDATREPMSFWDAGRKPPSRASGAPSLDRCWVQRSTGCATNREAKSATQ